MIKDWSKLLNLLPEEIQVDEFNRPLDRGVNINQIIELMSDEYGFRVSNIKYGTKFSSEDETEVDYNIFKLYFINDDEEQVEIYMYGENLNNIGITNIAYTYTLDLDNNCTRIISDYIYQPIGIVTYTYNY